jgi:hypothetical protein
LNPVNLGENAVFGEYAPTIENHRALAKVTPAIRMAQNHSLPECFSVYAGIFAVGDRISAESPILVVQIAGSWFHAIKIGRKSTPDDQTPR